MAAMEGAGKLVAVRYQDKRLLKGWTRDFMPNRNHFHLRLPERDSTTRVQLGGMKAVFFLKTMGRDPAYFDRHTFSERAGNDTKIWLEFTDGEKLAGWSNSFTSSSKGFYLFPADADSNLEKAYVFRSAIERLEQGEDAEAAARAFERVSRVLEPTTVALAGPGDALDSETSASEVAVAVEVEVGEYRLTGKQLSRYRIEKL